MKKSILTLSMLALIGQPLFTGCASIVSKSNYPLSIKTDPEGMSVVITDKQGKEIFEGQSPTTVMLKAGAGFFSKAEYQVVLEAPGYQKQNIPVYFKLDGWYFGNIVFGGLIGLLIVDPATGAMWKLDSPSINVTMEKLAASIQTPTLQILDINNLPKELEQYLVKIK